MPIKHVHIIFISKLYNVSGSECKSYVLFLYPSALSSTYVKGHIYLSTFQVITRVRAGLRQGDYISRKLFYTAPAPLPAAYRRKILPIGQKILSFHLMKLLPFEGTLFQLYFFIQFQHQKEFYERVAEWGKSISSLHSIRFSRWRRGG